MNATMPIAMTYFIAWRRPTKTGHADCTMARPSDRDMPRMLVRSGGIIRVPNSAVQAMVSPRRPPGALHRCREFDGQGGYGTNVVGRMRLSCEAPGATRY